MNFLFPWLLWERFLEKKRAKNAKIFEELGKTFEHPAMAELLERNPKMREDLRALGIKTGDANTKPPDE